MTRSHSRSTKYIETPVVAKVWRQRNVPQIREQEKYLEKELNDHTTVQLVCGMKGKYGSFDLL